jgi:hypothetical protein
MEGDVHGDQGNADEDAGSDHGHFFVWLKLPSKPVSVP